jgi:hypothetical protein
VIWSILSACWRQASASFSAVSRSFSADSWADFEEAAASRLLNIQVGLEHAKKKNKNKKANIPQNKNEGRMPI